MATILETSSSVNAAKTAYTETVTDINVKLKELEKREELIAEEAALEAQRAREMFTFLSAFPFCLGFIHLTLTCTLHILHCKKFIQATVKCCPRNIRASC